MFSPVKNTKVYELVIDQIKSMIVNGTLKRGDKLPPERELVEQLQVSRASIREAIRALQIIGLIECRQGEGNFIKDNFENSLFEPLSIMYLLGESKPLEILEVRRIIEIETAALAAKKITDTQLIELKGMIEEFRNNDDENENAKIDRELHYKIAIASGNFLIVSILAAVSSLIDAFIKDARSKILTGEKNKIALAELHEDIYKALSEHDPSEAAYAMRKHFEFVIKNIEI